MHYKMITGNKGEWSELYVFLKLLSESRLYGADAFLNKIDDVYYPIIKILRQEKDQTPKTYYCGTTIRIVNANDESLLLEYDLDEFINKTELLLQSIKRGNTSAFNIPEIEQFMDVIKCTSIKAKSEDKRDITMVVHDMNTGMTPELGFSIKSRIGGSSTMFNANKKATNFIFEINGVDLSDQEIVRINAIEGKSKIRKRVQEILSAGGILNYIEMEGQILSLNLRLIDTALPIIVSHMLRAYYSGQGSEMAQLILRLEQENPCEFDISHNHPFYLYKIKRMLTDMALGMTSGSVWDGRYDVTGGYIVVKEDGDVLCYHLYNQNEFQEYLVRNTHLDTPSCSRHGFGCIYRDGNRLFIKFGLQIRF